MKWLLFLLILIPAIEITVLIGSSHVIGLWSTFAMIVFTGVVGVYLAKRQGFKVLGEIQSKLNRGEMRDRSTGWYFYLCRRYSFSTSDM